MKLSDFQKKVNEFVEKFDLETTVESRMLDLVSETGELSKEILKGTDYGKKPFEKTGEFESELADAFFSLICIANSTKTDMEAGLDSALAKYEKRLKEKGNAGSGR